MSLQIGKSFTIPLDAVTQTFAILAKRGVGKTYTANVMAEEMLENTQQIVVIDPVGVWWGLRSSKSGNGPGHSIVVFGGEHADVPLEEGSGELIAQMIVEHGFSAILDLSLFRKNQSVRFMTAFAEAIYRLNRKPLHIFADEADAFCPQRPMKGEERMLGAFEDIARRGRARGIGLTLISQRAAVINKNVLTQIEVLVCLRTISPQDRAAVETWIEVHGTEKQKDEMMSHIASLPIGTAYFWSPAWLDIFKKVEIRERRTFDSSATPKVGEVIQKPKQMAPVDLTALGKQIQETIEAAKDSDPAELRARIRKLEGQLQKTKVVQQPAQTLSKSDRNRLLGLVAVLKGNLEEYQKIMAKLEGIEKDRQSVEDAFKYFKNVLEPQLTLPKIQTDDQIRFGPVSREKSVILSKYHLPERLKERSIPHIPQNGDESLSKAQREFLTVLANRQGKLTRRNQIAIFSGYSSKSSHVDNTLSSLRTKSFLDGGKDELVITSLGLAALGPYDPLPTGQALFAMWQGQLPSAAGKMLKQVCLVYPHTINRDQLAEVSGFSVQSSHVDNTISLLRTMELITGGKDALKASPELMD